MSGKKIKTHNNTYENLLFSTIKNRINYAKYHDIYLFF